MSASDRAKLKPAIELFCSQNNTKAKKYDTYKQFKDYKVYNREALIRLIKKCVTEIDMGMIVKMFDNLKPKIHKTMENGLESLV